MKRLDLRELVKRFMNKEMLRAPSVKDNAQTALIGLAILAAGMFFRADALGNFREIEAEVTKIEYVSEDRLTETSDARVYVSYTVDGKEYRDIRCNKHGNNVRVGDLVKSSITPLMRRKYAHSLICCCHTQFFWEAASFLPSDCGLPRLTSWRWTRRILKRAMKK